MGEQKLKVIKTFYGGITRDEKSRINGAALNVEELDIFSNADFVQAEQIMTADTLPATTNVYAYDSGSTAICYAYGEETGASKVRLLSVASGGSDDPGAFSTLFTSADATNLAYKISPLIFHRTTEANTDYLYYLTKASTTISLKRYSITGASESTVGTLTGLDGTGDRVSFKKMFGEIIITNGKYIAKVDKDGVFTDDAFVLPNDWIAVDMIAVSDVCLILSRYVDSTVNFCKGYWWDLTSTAQVDDSFNLPSGGPQWIVNHQESILMLCAHNGSARFFALSGAYPGSLPQELPGITLANVGLEVDLQPVSSSKMVAEKDKVLYFSLFKTDKTGIYALGKLDADKPRALVLSKRYSTSDYSLHKPTSLFILGPNYYGSFNDNGTSTAARCESRNSPNRSTSAIYESVQIDDDSPLMNKSFDAIYIGTKPLTASTDINVFTAYDYGSYGEVFRDDGTSLATTSAVQGAFKTTLGKAKKVTQVKVELVSSGANSPKLTSIGIKMTTQRTPSSI